MKQAWQTLSTWIDALTLRERVIIFILAVVVLLTLVNSLLLESQFAHQKQITQRIRQGQDQIAEVQTEIQQVVQRHNADPNRQNRMRLEQLQQQVQQKEAALQSMQRGLIPPAKMSTVLEEILQKNGKLQLVSLKSLPATSLTGQADGGRRTGMQAAPGAAKDGLYKHGVEIKVRGSYHDILDYLEALEAMPWQLFWGDVRLEVVEHPASMLTLTLFSLSLDEKWLDL